MNENEVRVARRRFMEIYGGVDNWGKIAVLDQAGKYTRIGLGFDEMGFEAIDERSEVRLFSPFGVPLTLIPTRAGLKASTYDNKTSDRTMFWQDVMLAELGLFEEEWQEDLVPNNADIDAMFDTSRVPALAGDMTAKAKTFDLLVGDSIPIQDAARLAGLEIPRLAHGKAAFIRTTLQPLDQLMAGQVQSPANALSAVDPERFIQDLIIAG